MAPTTDRVCWHFLRHAEPDLRPDVSGHEWGLSEQGRLETRQLAEKLSRDGSTRLSRVWSSPEPKALETARIVAETIGLPLTVEPDLREHQAPDLPLMAPAAFASLVGRFLASAGEHPLGAESWESLEHRFDSVLRRGLSLGADSDGLVLATHGRWLACGLPRYLSQSDGFDRVAWWKALERPDWVSVQLPAGVSRLAELTWEIVG